MELISSRNGQLDVGLAFFHVTSRLRVDILSAFNLRAVNLYGDHSDPYAKVKVFRQSPGGKVEKWRFETKPVFKTIEPVWNQS
jgi:Ca2+-dependent lipid-binding protein